MEDQITISQNKYFSTVKTDKSLLKFFLKELPKGGLIGNEIILLINPKDLYEIAIRKNYYIDKKTYKIYCNRIGDNKDNEEINHLLLDSDGDVGEINHFLDTYQVSKSKIISAWTIRQEMNLTKREKIIDKFSPILLKYKVHLISKICKRLAKEDVIYLESIISLPNILARIRDLSNNIVSDFINKTVEINDLNDLFKTYEGKKIDQLFHETVNEIEVLSRETKTYGVCLKYILAGYRNTQSHVEFFGQLYIAFRVADISDHVVGIALIGDSQNDGVYNNYLLHLKIIDFFKDKYPTVKITLNNKGLETKINPKALIKVGLQVVQADKISCSSEMLFEDDFESSLLDFIKQKDSSFEIDILNKNRYHNAAVSTKFFHILDNNSIPVSLLDNRSRKKNRMTSFFLNLIESHPDVKYTSLKKIIYNSIEYGLLDRDNKDCLINKLDIFFQSFENEMFDSDTK